MAQIGNSPVVVGDVLRQDATGFEGTVTAVNGDSITLSFPPNPFSSGDTWTGPASECHFNVWDAKYAASSKTPPPITPTDMATANPEVFEAVKQQEAQDAVEAKAAVDAEVARVQAEQEAAAQPEQPAATEAPAAPEPAAEASAATPEPSTPAS